MTGIEHKTFVATCTATKSDADTALTPGRPDAGAKSELATKLEAVSDQALDKLAEIMSLPLVDGDPAFASLLRSQTTAAGVALNTQVRVDEVALRKQEHDRMPELLRLAAEVRARLPPLEELDKLRVK